MVQDTVMGNMGMGSMDTENTAVAATVMEIVRQNKSKERRIAAGGFVVRPKGFPGRYC